MGLRIDALPGPLGADCSGIDLANDPGPADLEAIRAALRDHLLLIFRGQSLDRERMLAVADWFGGPYRPRPDEPTLGDASLDPVVLVSNVHERGVLGAKRVRSHADQEYLRDPSPATMLHAVEVPSSGGETAWSNLFLAYEALPLRLRRRLEGLQRWTDNPYAGGANRMTGVTGPNQRVAAAEYPVAAHPVVRTQPGTKRKALYVSSITTGIRGVRGPGASWRAARLLRKLRRHVEQDRFFHTHAWRPGDFVVWDNLFTNHRRAAFDAGERRVLLRVQIAAAAGTTAESTAKRA